MNMSSADRNEAITSINQPTADGSGAGDDELHGPFSQFTSYEFAHLVSHLEEAGRFDELHRILSLETARCRNAWYEVKAARDDIDGYIADLTRAWRIAAMHPHSIALQCQYALMASSVKSL